jgi:hypothetical protein
MKQPRFSLQKKRLGSLSLESNLNSDCIIPDILSPKTTRAFWRQNNFNINKRAPLGAKLLGAFHWKCSTPFYS